MHLVFLIEKQITYHAEKYNDPILFPLYYQDPKQYAFAYQISSFVNRLITHEEVISKSPGINILDQPFEADRWIYGEANRENMKETFHVYDKLYRQMSKRISEPEVYVYVRIPKNKVKVLQDRIMMRGRKAEQELVEDSSYLEELIDCNDRFFHLKQDKTIVIDATQMRAPGGGVIDFDYIRNSLHTIADEIIRKKLF